ncbi:protein FAM193A-like isoform X1 [Carassius gibelio]|uniref:protein FAM193A-like isoform X1 n=1 Tax=Carassius gibelio TaxID=101364 RepID=UPI0022779E20|nr:protein FAM193A-like isoform X1 [Carassius gibelio]
MSPTDAKRGAKRRKNKRGGGAGKAGAPPTPSSGSAHGDPSTIPSLNREVPVNGAPQFSEGPVNADFSGVLQTPFTFGVNQRAPYTTGDRCLLCRSERKDTVSHDIGGSSQNGTAQSPKSSSALQLPLYVCSDCKRTVEKDDRQPSLDQLNQDFLLHMPMGNGGLSQEPLGAGGRLTVGTPTLPAPDLSTPLTVDTVCSCEACYERREITAESERESQQLQNHWSEVRYLVRCIYRQTGTPLADDQDQPLDRDSESMKELVDRLCEKDPYQLYQRLEQQAREYVLEMKVRLLKHLSTGSKAPGAVAQGPPQAHQFISLLLEEYSALCQAARTISSFLLTLENEHLQKFQVTWELHNKHLFENLVFSEPILHNSLPALVARLRQGTTSHDSYSEDMYRTLLERYHQLDQEMSAVALEWLECEKRIDDYVDEQLLFKVEGQNLTNQRTEPHKSLINRNMSLRTKQRMLQEDAEIFKQKRLFEEQLLPNSKKSLGGDSKFTDTVKQMLSSRLSIPDCPNCNYRRRCTCDDCSLSHILTCGIMDAPMAEDLHLKLPLQAEPPRNYLSEVHPPSMSSGSSGSGSTPGSPITIQQHPRLILPHDGTTTFDDEVPPMSAIYPLSGYEDPAVVASFNGIHSQLSGGEESMNLKDKSSRGSSSSSSSSEGDDEERESGEEPPGQKVSLSGGKNDRPPPSYPHSQVDQVQHPCECHVCNQGNGDSSASSLNSTRLHAGGHQFFSEKTAAHPALHLYPHIHGHLPLHNLSHLPRPLLPTLYSTPPLTHSKTLPPTPTSNQTGGKQQVFNPTLPEHVYQSCFNTAGDWNGSLPCPSLKLENLWDTHMMKNWNPSVLLQEPLPGDMLGPPLPDVPLLSSSLDPNVNPHFAPYDKEKKNGAKKKCLFNYQDAFMEASEVVMATSSATSSVSSTTTTVQSNEVFHNLGKEDHRHPTPVAPRNSPTSIASLPPLSGTSHPSSPNTHLPSIGTQSFPKTVTPGYMDIHQGLCLSAGEQPTTLGEGLVSGPNSVCSDPDCEGHRCEGNGGYEHQPYEGEESQDEDSSSEHSSSTSTSTNQKEGKYCDCCYCEFFGHGGPPAAPTSRNYAEMREKLRLRLTKRKEEQPKKEELLLERDGVEDDRKVEDLLQFINSADSKPPSSSKAAKRARHKQKKLEEKARLEAEARELEIQQQFLKEQSRRQQEEEEAALKRELLRLQEMQQLRASKKKKKDKVKEVTKSENPLVPTTNSPQPLQQTAQSVLEKNMQNGKTQLLHNLIRLSPKEPRIEPESPTGGKNGPLQQPCKERPSESLALQNGTSSHPESSHTKVKPKQQAYGSKPNSEATKRPAETSKASELPKAGNAASPQTDTKAKQKASDESVTEIKRDERTNGKKPQNGGKDERNSPVTESSAVEPPQQNGKVPNNESPQPKSKAKKNKKKKADKTSNSIDDVFLPKDIDLDSVDMDETEREVEYFKRFCLDSARQTRQRLSINWSNFSLKKATFAAH